MTTPLLDVRNLRVAFGGFPAVDGVSFSVAPGELLGIVGESGSGKSAAVLAALGLVDAPGVVSADALRFCGQDLLAMTAAQRRRIVGRDVAMVFQDALNGLNPSHTVGDQVREVLRVHLKLRGAALQARVLQLFDQVEIPAAKDRLASYPHQLSGGMNQRVMIAMAIACDPRLLIADEPTTALDVTIQAQVMDLLARLQRERGMGLLLITHDLAVVARMAHRVSVLYAGQVVETAVADRLFAAPRHPYTAALLAALPEHNSGARRLAALPGIVPGRHDRPAGCLFAPRCPRVQPDCVVERPALEHGVRCFHPLPAPSTAAAGIALSSAPDPRAEVPTVDDPPVLQATELTRHYRIARGLLRPAAVVRALHGVSFTLHAGRTLAVVGESGCGKSTLARQLTLVEQPTAGSVRIGAADAAHADKALLRTLRRRVQMVFQNPYASLNPRKTVAAALAEPLVINTTLGTAERRERVRDAMARVGLRPEHAGRYPHMFSGGQRQRIAIARAMMLGPAVVVADEPTAALDVSIQAQVLNLFMDLQDATGAAYVFISHNLAVVAHVAHDVMVMYFGSVVEHGARAQVLGAPLHPYTRALLAAAPLVGEMPNPLAPPGGCSFHTRCPLALPRCRAEVPLLRAVDGRQVACHLA